MTSDFLQSDTKVGTDAAGICSALSVYVALGGYLLFAAYPGSVRQLLTEKYVTCTPMCLSGPCVLSCAFVHNANEVGRDQHDDCAFVCRSYAVIQRGWNPLTAYTTIHSLYFAGGVKRWRTCALAC